MITTAIGFFLLIGVTTLDDDDYYCGEARDIFIVCDILLEKKRAISFSFFKTTTALAAKSVIQARD